MEIQKYYIVKHNSRLFKPETIVKLEICTDSGKCYLVSHINSDIEEREWIMYYDLYPVDKNKVNNYFWYYDDKYNTIAENFIYANKNK